MAWSLPVSLQVLHPESTLDQILVLLVIKVTTCEILSHKVSDPSFYSV